MEEDFTPRHRGTKFYSRIPLIILSILFFISSSPKLRSNPSFIFVNLRYEYTLKYQQQ
jgi:hypothetical protein